MLRENKIKRTFNYSPSYTEEIDFLESIIDKNKLNHKQLYDLIYKIAIEGMGVEEANESMIEAGVVKKIRTYQSLLRKLSKGKLELRDFKIMYNINNPSYVFEKHNKRGYNNGRYKRDYIPARKRYLIMLRDDFKCVVCGRKGNGIKLHLDHIIPKSKGGDDSVDNLRTLCALCNLGKGDIMEDTK